jgi:hypothetical protein
MLRLEVPVEQRDQDVHIAVVVESAGTTSSEAELVGDMWAPIRSQLESAGMRVPPPGCKNAGLVSPIELPGPAASAMLVSDRR